MPVVPFGPRDDAPAQPDPPPEGFALMAAAQMHKEGRLVKPQPKSADGFTPYPNFRKSGNIEDRRETPMTPDELFAMVRAPKADDTLDLSPKNGALSKKLGVTDLNSALSKKDKESNAN